MLKKYLLFIILIALSITIYSGENILIITNSSKNYLELKELVEDNSYYNIQFFLDDSNNLENILNYDLTFNPRISFYLNFNDTNNLSVQGINKRFLPDFKVLKYIITELNIQKQTAKEFPLNILNLVKRSETEEIFYNNELNTIIINGVFDTSIIFKSLDFLTDIKNRDNNYLITYLFNNVFYLNSKLVFLINSICIIIIIIIFSFNSKATRFHIKNNNKFLITVPLKIFSIFIFYFMSSLVVEYIVFISNDNKIYLNFPKTIFLIKHLVLFFMYNITYRIIKDSSFSKSPYFYSHFSFYLSLISYFISCLFFLPLGTFQVWPIIITTLYILINNGEIRRFLLFINPIMLIIFLLTYLNNSHEYFVNIFLNNRYIGNTLLTIIITPFIFLHESFYRFTSRTLNKITYTKDIILSLILLTTIITLTAIILELN